MRVPASSNFDARVQQTIRAVSEIRWAQFLILPAAKTVRRNCKGTANADPRPAAGRRRLTDIEDRALFPFAQSRRRFGPAFAASLACHVALLLLALVATRFAAQTDRTADGLVKPPTRGIVWLLQPGPAGGGGGGGNRMKEPPRRAEMPGQDRVTVPVSTPPALEDPQATNEPEPMEQPIIPARSLAAAAHSLPGAIEAPSGASTLSQGPGTDDGAGTGVGPGIGPDSGPGLGTGAGGGTGGRVYQIGSGVTAPIALHRSRPHYTSDAMRARIQGPVVVECVVQTNGTCTDIHVVRSLDPTFGLDREAIKAAGEWRFRPAMRLGQPVPVMVTIELTFTLH